MTLSDDRREWLEADGRGGFASGTVNGIRTRRYHGLLLTATSPPTGRMMLVNGMEVWAISGPNREALTSQRYAGDVIFPDGASRLQEFSATPWPRWTWRLKSGALVTQELFVVRRTGATVVTWSGNDPEAELEVRLLCSGRDYHSLHQENVAFAFAPALHGDVQELQPYPGVPSIFTTATGTYDHRPEWYRRFSYVSEEERGLDSLEDLASPGLFRLPLRQQASIVLASTEEALDVGTASPLAQRVASWRSEEWTRRAAFTSPLDLAADAYLVRRGTGATIIAGYPWFTDWGRDTFIALRGLCLATGRLHEARDIVLEWSAVVSAGMVPNRFPDGGGSPEYNSVDASLWFVIAAGDLVRACNSRPGPLSSVDHAKIDSAIDAVLTGYASGTRDGIRADADGLLMAGVPDSQLTWMDARVGDKAMTPRVGKPVEVQALWLNALAEGARSSPRWKVLLDRGTTSFQARFWNAARGCLYDVVDVDHVQGHVDASIRPNQILAIGGLPRPLLTGDYGRKVVDVVERQLLTPLGLRSLAPGEPGYSGQYTGEAPARDASYHQGTVWPWLIGPFVDAWLRVNGRTPERRQEARSRFVEPLMRHLQDAGIGHVSEIADGDAPFTPRGCPFQAWSLGELLCIERLMLDADHEGGMTKPAAD